MSPSFRTKYQAERPKLILIVLGLIVGTVLLYLFAPPFAGKGPVEVFSKLLNTRLVYVILMVLPLNFIAISLLLMVFLFIKNQTRYFAFPTDVFLHKLIVVTIVISVLRGIFGVWDVQNGMYIEPNPILNLYYFALGDITTGLGMGANILLFCTIYFLPLFLFAMTQLDYDYLLSLVVGYTAAILATLLSFIYLVLIESPSMAGMIHRLNIPRDDPAFNFFHIILWVGAYIVYWVFIRWYDSEHQIAEKTGAAIHIPTVKRRHFLGFVWRPGRKAKRGSMVALIGALMLIIVLVVMLMYTGNL